MKFLLAIVALASSGLVVALDSSADCGAALDCAAGYTPSCPPSISDIPECAQQCILNAADEATQCSTMPPDFGCFCKCKNELAIIGESRACVVANCTAEVAAGEVLPALLAFCKATNACGGDV